MQVGDLVRPAHPDTIGAWLGTITKVTPGTAKYCVVIWQNGCCQNLEEKHLKKISL